MYLSGQNASGTNKNKESEEAFGGTKENIWLQDKNMWEEQLVYSPIDYIVHNIRMFYYGVYPIILYIFWYYSIN